MRTDSRPNLNDVERPCIRAEKQTTVYTITARRDSEAVEEKWRRVERDEDAEEERREGQMSKCKQRGA